MGKAVTFSLKIGANCAEKQAMAVYFCMAFLLLIALGAAVVAYAIFTAEEGCEDEQGFRPNRSPDFSAVAPEVAPLKKSNFRVFNPDIPLPFFL